MQCSLYDPEPVLFWDPIKMRSSGPHAPQLGVYTTPVGFPTHHSDLETVKPSFTMVLGVQCCCFQRISLNFLQLAFSPSESYSFPFGTVKVKVKSFSRVRLFATPWTVAHQAPPSMGFCRQVYWRGVPFPSRIQVSHIAGRCFNLWATRNWNRECCNSWKLSSLFHFTYFLPHYFSER